MTYLKHIQKENSNQIYEPEIICNGCGNQEQGDDPPVHIQHCFLCEELVSSVKRRKNHDSRNYNLHYLYDSYVGVLKKGS